MADNNKNPRRTIWLSETEPLSHYDIWLSKNQHLNSDGEPLSDSGVQRPCDYIFKVWDCDNWYPIIGFNSTAVNKINTVLNTSYTTTHNGNSINSSSYQEFHLPLFTSSNSSPQELFDAGTIGEAILEYVTEQEWENIFEGNAFSYAFKWYIEEGDTNINFLVDPAEADKLGGIYADEFQLTDIFPDSIEIPSQPQINNSYNWIAQAKYKYNHGTSDYNLYVSAKDVIGAINHYQIENPEASGIQPSNDFEWRLANTEEIGGIKADVHNHYANAFKPIECKFYPNYGNWSSIHERLCINARDVIDSIIESFSDPNENWLFGNHGITIGQQLGGNRIEWAIDGLGIANNGQYARCKVTEGVNRHSIEWVDLPEIENYDLLESGSSALEKYVVKGGSNDKHYLNGNGEWTVPEGTQYTEGPFIKIENGTIGIKANPANGSWYIKSDSGILSWASAPEQTTFIQGTGIKIENTTNSNEKTISVNTQGGSEGQFLSIVDTDTVGWRTIPSSTPTTYTNGIGIDIDENNNNAINIAGVDNTTIGKYLKVNSSGDNVEWAEVQPEQYTEGVGIDITNNKISSEISINNNALSASSSLAFNCALGTSSNPIGNVTVSVDQGTPVVLAPFSYTKINLDTNGGSGTIRFVVFNQKDIMNGDPVFIELILDGTIEVSIEDSNQNGCSYIDSNGVLQGNGFKVHHVLVTIQFGIVKFEAIEQYSSLI